MKPVRFYPIDKKYKQPIGAARSNDFVTITMEILRSYHVREMYFVLNKENEEEIFYSMHWDGNSDDYEKFTTSRIITSSGLYFYYFLANTEHGQFRIGADNGQNAMLGAGGKWQLSVTTDYYHASDIFCGGIMYQIFVDRFAIGGERKKTNPANEYRDDWGQTPRYTQNHKGEFAVDFFGGNLQGVIDKLDYLQSLNVSIIYFNPIFRARSNHKYDTGDYMCVDPDFGSNDDFERLAHECKKRGIKIMLDGVFSHTGSDSIYFNKYGSYQSVGAFQSPYSPYYSWYRFKNYPDSYECWWNFDTLPNVDEFNLGYNDFINGKNGVVRTWLRRGADAWRLDVADELPDLFLDRLAEAAKTEKPDTVIIGEVWEDASNKFSYGERRRFLEGRQLSSVMNYPFKKAIIDFVMHGDSVVLKNEIATIVNNYPKSALDSLMNVLGTHDTARILTALSGEFFGSREQKAQRRIEDYELATKRLRLATTLQFTLPGVPCIFYGDEAGMEGYEDPLCRGCYPWGRENKKILDWYKKLTLVRSQNKDIFSKADYECLHSQDGVFAFLRRQNGKAILVVVNNSSLPYQFETAESCEVLLGGSMVDLQKFVVAPHDILIAKY